MTKIILVRHGHSVTNDSGKFTGQLNAELSQIGVCQAELLSKYIIDNYAVNQIYSSDLDRAVVTISNVAKHFNLEIIKDKNLREIFAGKWQGKTATELKEQFGEQFSVWQNDIGNAITTGGESVKTVQKRAINAINRIVNDNKDKVVVVVSHALFIRTLICFYQGKTLSDMKNISYVPNASVSELEFDQNGECKINVLGYNGYLGELDTNLKAGI